MVLEMPSENRQCQGRGHLPLVTPHSLAIYESILTKDERFVKYE